MDASGREPTRLELARESYYACTGTAGMVGGDGEPGTLAPRAAPP